jgi:hypothetical protein
MAPNITAAPTLATGIGPFTTVHASTMTPNITAATSSATIAVPANHTTAGEAAASTDVAT